ncbi:MAG: extracellular solute-binding protein [Acidimicrobiales bacterium]
MRRWALAAVAGAVVALASGCGGGGDVGGGASTSITLYSGQHQQTTQSLVAAFEKDTGIKVQVRYNDEDFLANEIVAEASHPKADVFYTENSPALEYLQEKGLLAPVRASTLAEVPAKYDSPKGEWVGISARVSVVVYNPKLLPRSEVPRSVLGLAAPEYKGKLALAPSETDFQPIVTAVDRAYGEARTLEWLRRVRANAAGHVYSDNEAITSEVNRGAVALGVINQYYWYRLRAEIGASGVHSAIAHFAPDDPGYVVDVSGAAALRSSRHPGADQRFLAFLVSKQGQEVLAGSDSFEYPLAHGVKPGTGETPFGQLRPYPITIAELGDGGPARTLLRKAGLQ